MSGAAAREGGPAGDPAGLRSLVAALVAEALAAGGGGPVEVGPDEPLLSSGLIDSLALVRLLEQLGQRCSLSVDPIEVSLENFDTLARIEAFVLAKLGGGRA